MTDKLIQAKSKLTLSSKKKEEGGPEKRRKKTAFSGINISMRIEDTKVLDNLIENIADISNSAISRSQVVRALIHNGKNINPEKLISLIKETNL